MRTAEARVRLPVPGPSAMDLLWDLGAWRRIWDPVESVTVLYEDPCHQEFVMRVERDGAVERVRTVRYRRAAHIEFFSPDPPPMMVQHAGTWAVHDLDGATVVHAVRRYRLRPGVTDPEGFDRRLSQRLQAILGRFAHEAAA